MYIHVFVTYVIDNELIPQYINHKKKTNATIKKRTSIINHRMRVYVCLYGYVCIHTYIFNFSTNKRNAHFLKTMIKFCLINQPSKTKKETKKKI